MDKKAKLTWGVELLWWMATAVAVAAVLLPILTRVPDYPFLLGNIIFVTAFITFTRYIFLLKHTFLAYRQVLKVVVFFLFFPIIFLIVEQINHFQTYLDNYGFVPMLGHLPLNTFNNLSRYIYNEMLFFGVGAVVAGVILPFRLLISVWRLRNRGKV